MKPSVKSFLMALAAALAASSASAQPQLIVTGQITAAPAGGGSYDYTVTLHNSASSTVSMESFWYAWTPGQFYLPTTPTGYFGLPTGWAAVPFANSVQFYTMSSIDAIAPGGLTSFSYVSVDTPAQEFGTSGYPGHPPVGTSVAYQTSGFGGAADTFVVQPAPEPSSVALLLAGSLGLFVAVRRGKISEARRL
jgi:hypothetical protein